MTSGMAKDSVIKDAKQMSQFLHRERVNFICDFTDLVHGRFPEPPTAAFTRFLKELNNRITPWITLEEPEFSLKQVVSLINTYDLRRVIRVSLRQPGESTDNRYLKPDQIEEAVRSLFSYTDLLDTFRVKLNFDCGFGPCCFTD